MKVINARERAWGAYSGGFSVVCVLPLAMGWGGKVLGGTVVGTVVEVGVVEIVGRTVGVRVVIAFGGGTM